MKKIPLIFQLLSLLGIFFLIFLFMVFAGEYFHWLLPENFLFGIPLFFVIGAVLCIRSYRQQKSILSIVLLILLILAGLLTTMGIVNLYLLGSAWRN